jgi:hypothetical protein
MAPAAPGVEAEGARPGMLHNGAAASPPDVGATQATQPAPDSGRDLPVSKGAAVDGACASAAPVPSNSSDDSAGLAPVRGGPLGRCAAPARTVWQAGSWVPVCLRRWCASACATSHARLLLFVAHMSGSSCPPLQLHFVLKRATLGTMRDHYARRCAQGGAVGGELGGAGAGHVQRVVLHILCGQHQAHLDRGVPYLLEGARRCDPS